MPDQCPHSDLRSGTVKGLRLRDEKFTMLPRESDFQLSRAGSLRGALPSFGLQNRYRQSPHTLTDTSLPDTGRFYAKGDRGTPMVFVAQGLTRGLDLCMLASVSNGLPCIPPGTHANAVSENAIVFLTTVGTALPGPYCWTSVVGPDYGPIFLVS